MSSHFLQSTPEISAPTWLAPRSGQPDFLDRLNRGLIRASSVREIGDFVTSLLLENTAAESCSLLLLDEITGVLEVVGIETESTVESQPSLMDSVMSPDGGQGVAAWVASQCVPVRLEEASKDERFVLAGGTERGRKFADQLSAGDCRKGCGRHQPQQSRAGDFFRSG